MRQRFRLLRNYHHQSQSRVFYSFFDHAKFYHCFIKDLSKITKPLYNLLVKDVHFDLSKECLLAFNTLKEKLTSAQLHQIGAYPLNLCVIQVTT